MPNLPSYGWLDRCEDCDMITSRLMTIRHKRKCKTIYVCPKCRFHILEMLLVDFSVVIVKNETVAHINIMVSS